METVIRERKKTVTPESKLLIGLLRQTVAGKQTALSFDINWQKFYHIARAHALEPLAYHGLKQSKMEMSLIPEDIHHDLYTLYMQAFHQSFLMDTTLRQLHAKLLTANVPHVFLKGAELKKSYPVPELRTMCDADILVRTEDYAAIDAIAESIGAKATDGDGNHRNFTFPGEVYVEFHPNLLHHGTPVGTGINPGWQYTRQTPGGGIELTEEGFYLNTLCHLANHFVAGGVGVRFVLDVWVGRHLRKPEPDWSYVQQELEKFGLAEFAKNIEDLAECWFGEGESTPLLEELGDYILRSGLHGNQDMATLNAVSLSGSRSKALLKKIFYPRAELEDRFPWCKGRPLLLPAAWCTRAFRAVTRRGHLIRSWSKKTGAVSETDATKQKEKLAAFGIKID